MINMENREIENQRKIEFLKSITYTEINEMLNELWNKNKSLLDEIERLKNELKAADSVNENLSKQVEWISVEDRLPEGVTSFKTMSDYVMVFNESIFGTGRYCHDRKEWFALTPKVTPITNVTHWMPLPNQSK